MKRKIRLVAIDLDGTLLNSRQEVTQASVEALKRITQDGMQTVLVTGRCSTGAEVVLDMLGMDLPYVGCAGSLICAGKGGQVISARPFHSPTELHEVIAYVREHGAGLVTDLPDGEMRWYGPDDLLDELDPLSAATARDSIRTFSPEQDFDRKILKMSVVGSLDFLNAMEQDVLSHLDSLHHAYAGLHFMDLTAQGVDKGSGLELFAQYAKIPAAEIAAIGDQPIDMPMLSFSGLSIAMGNAPQALKELADWTAPSNDEDGVAQALMKILDENA